MKRQFLKKTIAGLMALLIVSGGMPLQPVSKIFERTAITAKATNIAPTPITGLVAEKNEYGYWKFQALANAGEYDEVSDLNYWYSVELIEIYDDTMSDEEKDFEIFEYNADYSLYYTTSVPKGNYPGKYKVYYGIAETDDVENPSSFEVIITKEGTVIPSESVSESGQGTSSTEPTGSTEASEASEASEESEESEESEPTIVSTTVENGIYTGFTATSGTTGANTSEGYAKLVDGNKSKKWCIIDLDGTCYVEFNSDIPFIPTGYILTTGNDNSEYTGRNPAGWKLYGKLNENDAWTVLAEVTQDTVLEDKDNQSYDFDIKDNTSAYQYFRFEFSQAKDSNVFQLSELQFKGEAVEEATDPTEPSSESESESTESNSEPIEIPSEFNSEPTGIPSESESESTEPSSENTDVITVYFVDTCFDDVHVHYWGSEESVAWPGTEMKKYKIDEYGQQVYSAEIPANVEGIIFNGNGKQTVDITNNISNGTMWYITGDKDDVGHFEVDYMTETPSESESESTEFNSEPTETEFESEPSSENTSEPTETESESEPAQTLVSVTYLDENGTEQTVDAIPLESGSESYTYLEAGWYVVNSNITYQEVLELNGDVKLILADNCTMTMTDDAQIYGNSHNLTIYGQTNGTGKLESDILPSCVTAMKDYAQYGGIVDLKSKGNYAFQATGGGTLTLDGGTLNATSYDITAFAIAVMASKDINITGGTLNASCIAKKGSSYTGGYGIESIDGNINISGGKVTANIQTDDGGFGIYAPYSAVNITGGQITATSGTDGYGINTRNMSIGFSKASDYISANSYYSDSVVIADGQVLTDGTNLYYGTLTSEQISALAGKTLTKADSVPVSYVDVDKKIMTLPLYSTANAGYIDISTPYLDGYTYKCLTVNGEECADMLEVIAKAKAILKGNPEANITIAAVYEQNIEEFSVTVTGGTLDSGVSGDSYQVGTELTVTADSAEEGFQFDHWENNGKIASYNEVYSFHVPSKDVTLEAVYSTVGTEVEKVGTAFIESVKIIDNNKIAFVSKVSVPEGARILKAGIVANTEANLNGSELTTETAQFTRYENSKCYDYLTYKFTWTKSNVNEYDVWCVRPYLVYRDENGEHTVYGELVKESLPILC